MLAEQQNAQAEDALAQAAEGAEPAGSVMAVGAGELATGPPAVRFDLLATDGAGSPFLWRLLATYNDVTDPLRVEPGTVLSVPPGLPGSGASAPALRTGGSPVKSAAIAPAVEILVDGSILDDATLAPLASVRVARRLSLLAQCEIAFGRRAQRRRPAGQAAHRRRRRRHRGRRQGALFSGDVTAQEWVHGADGAAELRIRLRPAAPPAQAPEGHGPHRPHRRRPGRRAGRRRRPRRRGRRGRPPLARPRPAPPVRPRPAGRGGRAGRVVVRGDRRDAAGVQPGRTGDPVDLALHDTLLAARFDATADPACTSVTTDGWDPVAAVRLQGAADGPRNERDTGAAVGPSAVDADGEVALVDNHGPGLDHLDAAAQAELDRRVAREVTLTGTAEGDAALRPAARCGSAGPRPRCRAPTSSRPPTTRSTLPATSSSCRPVSPPAATDATVASLARVVSADDPDGLGRVKVALAGYGDVETDWREKSWSPGPGRARA